MDNYLKFKNIIQLLITYTKRKNPLGKDPRGFFFFKSGADLLSQALGQLPLALTGLTSLFGMGRGDPRRHRHQKLLIFDFRLMIFIYFKS